MPKFPGFSQILVENHAFCHIPNGRHGEGDSVEFCHSVSCEKIKIIGLPVKILMMSSAI